MGTNKSKNTKIPNISKKLRITMLAFFALLFLLILRLGFLQFVQGADLKERMYSQLIKSDLISPKRGTIYDATRQSFSY